MLQLHICLLTKRDYVMSAEKAKEYGIINAIITK
jgi:ATP-dependent protease ClpP protease subunit